MQVEAPSKVYSDIFDNAQNVFYGTDDGFQDGSFGEFEEFEAHYNSLPEWRKKNVHYASVVGGLYGLNMIPLWRPTEISFFDINPHAVAYFHLIKRAITVSKDKAEFLARLTHKDYEINDRTEAYIAENIALKQAGNLPRERGSSKRSFEASWRYALDHFDLTRSILMDVPVNVQTQSMEGPEFKDFVRDKTDLWIYCSNIFEFVYFDLYFENPKNVVLLSIIFPEQTDLLDLAPLSKTPIEVKCEIPMQLKRIREFKLIVP